jgi:hypothetical protein
MNSNRNDIGSRNFSISLSGLSLLSFCRMGMSRFSINEIKKQLEGIILFSLVDQSKVAIAPVGREILRG